MAKTFLPFIINLWSNNFRSEDHYLMPLIDMQA